MVFQCISWGLVSFTSENTNPTDDVKAKRATEAAQKILKLTGAAKPCEAGREECNLECESPPLPSPPA